MKCIHHNGLISEKKASEGVRKGGVRERGSQMASWEGHDREGGWRGEREKGIGIQVYICSLFFSFFIYFLPPYKAVPMIYFTSFIL